MRTVGGWWPAAAADLLLGGRCAGCHRPGRVLCEPCRDALPVTAAPRRPHPPPPGLAPAWSAASYEGVVRAMVVGHKEHGLGGLRGELGDLLAVAVAGALGDPVATRPGPGVRLLLVPVPSRAVSVRARGYDATAAMTRHAAAALDGAGVPTRTAGLLRLRPGVVDQAGLDREERRANLAGSMRVAPGALRRLAARGEAVLAVVCDDVLTTGASARESQRALEAVGVPVLAVATVAATPLRGGTVLAPVAPKV